MGIVVAVVIMNTRVQTFKQCPVSYGTTSQRNCTRKANDFLLAHKLVLTLPNEACTVTGYMLLQVTNVNKL